MFFSRRFLPYFCTQCLGALNDNIFKNILLFFATYGALEQLPIALDLFVNLAAALFIAPFLLFSAHAGQVADSMDKAKLIRTLKRLEIGIMAVASVAIVTQSYQIALLLLFLMGTQSAYFGPVKYALLPQALKSAELVSGNAWVELGTFVSILLGTLTAGVLASLPNGHQLAACIVVVLAVLGAISSQFIPTAPAATERKSKFSPFKATKQILSQARQTRSIWMAILAISWFWFLGATYLTQFPNFAKSYLHADSTVVSVLLALFSLGIAAGSLLCDKLSFKQVELGVLPFAILGLTLFSVDMVLALPELNQHTSLTANTLTSAQAFVTNPAHWRLMFDLFFIGVSGGLFIVPLYAFIQSRAQEAICAQIIAANNIINALFMVISALVAMALFSVLNWTIPQLFLLLALVNLVVAGYVYSQVPEFAQRFASYLLSHVMYRVRIQGREHIPSEGAALMIANHVSFVDALLLLGASTRPVRFVMDKQISEMPILKHLFRHAGVIPICSPRQCEHTYRQAFETISAALDNGELVCIFPEGRLTRDGQLGEFRPGVEKILARNPVPIIPVGLNGLWGSFFSRKRGAMNHLPRRFWSKIELNIGETLEKNQYPRATLQSKVAQLLND